MSGFPNKPLKEVTDTHGTLTLPGRLCPHCKKPMSTPVLDIEVDTNRCVNVNVQADELELCAYCVRLALCRMAVLRFPDGVRFSREHEQTRLARVAHHIETRKAKRPMTPIGSEEEYE
jgi:hypothetical protein